MTTPQTPFAHPPFAGTAAVVTGSSSGIGRATALALAEAGCRRQIVHCRRNVEGAKEVARSIGEDCHVIAADLTDPDRRLALVDECLRRHRPIQTWVFNAGADVLTGEAKELSFDQKLRRLFEVDVAATIDIARQVVERLEPTGGDAPIASMTFIGWDQSAAGMEGDAGQMFGPIKAAVTAFAMSLAQELAPRVRVNVVAPGWIKTAWGETTEGYWDRRARGQSLMRRWGRPEDVAQTILYAANPQHSFLTGQVLQVNGGWNRRFDVDGPTQLS